MRSSPSTAASHRPRSRRPRRACREVAACVLVAAVTIAAGCSVGPNLESPPELSASHESMLLARGEPGSTNLAATADTGNGDASRRPPVARPAETTVSDLRASVVPSAPSASEEIPETIRAAWQELLAGRPGAARRQLRQEVSADAKPARQTALGFAAYLLDETSSAGEAFERALRGRQEYPPALYGRGLLAEEAGDVDTARRMYRRAHGIDSMLVQAEIALGRLDLVVARSAMARAAEAEARGDDEAAIQEYRRALELAPSLERPHLELADLLLARDRADEAATLLREAQVPLDLEPRHLRALGQAALREGSYAEAIDALEKVRDARPDDPRIEEMLAWARERHEEASIPEEYRRLDEADVIHREDLAALVVMELSDRIGEQAATEPDRVIVDIGDSWAAPYVQEAVSRGMMGVFQNHDFLPGLPVTRGMLARVVSRIVERAGLGRDSRGPRIRDLPPNHMLYGPVQLVVALDLMKTDAHGNFGDVQNRVSGNDAIQVLERLGRYLREHGR